MSAGGAGSGRVGGHPDEALSSLLDGELDPSLTRAVHDHAVACRPCAEELAWLRAARWSLRNLPPVDPPPGALDAAVAWVAASDPDAPAQRGDAGASVRPLPHRRPLPRRPRSWTRSAPAAGVAAGLALLALAVVSSEPGSYRPAVDAAVSQHVASMTALSQAGGLGALDGGSDPLPAPRPVTATTEPRRDPARLAPPFLAPAQLDGGYRLVDAFATGKGEGLQLVYRSGRYGLSVFEAPGHLDAGGLPAGLRPIYLGGVPGWRWETEEVDGRVVVFEREGLVVIVIGDEPGDAVTRAARSVPEPRPPSIVQRLAEAGAGALDALSP